MNLLNPSMSWRYQPRSSDRVRTSLSSAIRLPLVIRRIPNRQFLNIRSLISEATQIGEGQFGEVLLETTWTASPTGPTAVAVKRCRSDANTAMRVTLEEEVGICFSVSFSTVEAGLKKENDSEIETKMFLFFLYYYTNK